MMRWQDTLYNLVSGLGGSKDKNISNRYTLCTLSDDQLIAAYRSDWIARKAVDIPAYDATREWRTWESDAADTTLIEAEEKRLDLSRKVRQAVIMARLYGGSGILLGVDGNPSMPIDPNAVRVGGLKYIHVLNRRELAAGQMNWDIRSPDYGTPLTFSIGAASNTPLVDVHCSRIIRFIGNDIPDRALKPNGWGDSILQVVDDAVKHAQLAAGGIATLINECKIDVVKVPDLMRNIATAEYRAQLTERFQLANTAKSFINTLILDKDEDWERITQSFAQMPDLLKTYMEIVSGAVDIPATRMLGAAPKGMNATGESDSQNYYDRVASDQENGLCPTLEPLDNLLIRSALGDRPDTVDYDWNPLWQMSEPEKATMAYNKAQTFQIDVNTNLVNPDALRMGRQNQLIEDGFYPGFEQALEDADTAAERDLTEEDPQVQAQMEIGKAAAITHAKMTGKPPAPTKDAAPRTLYVRRQVLNYTDIAKWARSQGIKDLDDPAGFHVTVLCSREPVDWMKMGTSYSDKDGKLTIPAGGPRLVEKLGADAIVLLFGSSELAWRHVAMVRMGASHDYDEYQPHITFTHAKGKVALGTIEPYRGVIELGPEIFEEVDDQAKLLRVA